LEKRPGGKPETGKYRETKGIEARRRGMKVLVGSRNPVKIEAVKEAFSFYFDGVEATGMSVDSKVSPQPFEDETFEGAKNRAAAIRWLAKKKGLDAQFFVGIEGGISKRDERWWAFGGMCIMDAAGRSSLGGSSSFELPSRVKGKIARGAELGDVMDELTGQENTKQKGGAIAFFSKGVVDRKNLYIQGLVMALVPFLNQALYFDGPA